MDPMPVISGDTLLYKFRSLETERQIEFAADILLNHRLFAAAPNSFNDPFDCVGRYCFDATEAEKIDRAVARMKLEDPSVRDEEARRLAPSRYLTAEAQGPARIRSCVENNIGVVSLAGTVSSPLLWAHYASGHTGICIEFCVSDFRHAEFFGNALPVAYQVDRPIIDFYQDQLDVQVSKYLLTKSQVWDYEREWRIIIEARKKPAYLCFDPTLVRAVYLGCQIAEDKPCHDGLRNTGQRRIFHGIAEATFF